MHCRLRLRMSVWIKVLLQWLRHAMSITHRLWIRHQLRLRVWRGLWLRPRL